MSRFRRNPRRILSALVSVAAALTANPAVAGGTYDVIANSGDSAFGTDGVFAGFQRPVINAGGQIAYRATLQSGVGSVGSNNDEGIWSGSTLIARKGSAAAGTAGVYNLFLDPIVGDGGHIAWLAFLRQGIGGVTSSNDVGMWRDSELVVREGDPAPGTTGVFQAPSGQVMNASGELFYRASLVNGVGGVTSANNLGIWHEHTLIAREGGAAGGTSGVFSNLTNPGFNDAGQMLFESSLLIGTGGVTASNNTGIWLDSNLLVREGDPAAGTSGVFGNFATPLINNAGQVVFQGTLTSGVGGVDFSNDAGLWRDDTLIAREDNPAGGTAGVFSRFSDPVINDSGQVAYEGFLKTGIGGVTSSDDTGLWLDSKLIAREGSAAAGIPGGAVFDGRFRGPLLNDGGQLLFTGNLRQGVGGVTSENDSGLWLYNPDGEGMLIAREGDSFDGRTIAAITIWQGTTSFDERRSALANDGQLAYRVQFTDGGEAIVRFTMTQQLHWSAPFSGAWDAAANWSLSVVPGANHDVFIDPRGDYRVTGPGQDLTINHLVIGGDTGIGTLALDTGVLSVNDGVDIEATGVLTGSGVVAGAVNNRGVVLAQDVGITGGLSNDRLVLGARGDADRISTNLNNNPGGEVRIGPQESLRLIGGMHANDGRIEVSEGNFEVDGLLTNNPDGQIFAEDSTLQFNDGLINLGQLNISFGHTNLSGEIAVGESGQLILSSNSTVTFANAVTNNGEIRVAEGTVVAFDGDVSGSGDFTGTGTKVYSTVFSPGQSPGLVTDAGDAIFGTDVTVIMEIGGRTQGVGYDHYDVAGTLELNGTLVIALLDGFDPVAGDEFDLFDWGSVSGAFSSVDLAAAVLAPGLAWDLDDLYTNGSLSVSGAPVPLPGALWLLMSALAGFSVLRQPGGAVQQRRTAERRRR